MNLFPFTRAPSIKYIIIMYYIIMINDFMIYDNRKNAYAVVLKKKIYKNNTILCTYLQYYIPYLRHQSSHLIYF